MSDEKLQEGPQTITLRKPISIDGVSVTQLQMREPTVGDQLANAKRSGTDAEKELAFIANLCMVKPSDLHALTPRDFKRVQEVLLGFFE